MGKDSMDDSPKVTLEDFVSTHKLVAFCETYVPEETEGAGTEVFNDIRLRKYFQAYPRNIGDPLNLYLEMLEKNGFRMRTSMQGEPALFVRRKTLPCQRALLDDAFGNG